MSTTENFDKTRLELTLDEKTWKFQLELNTNTTYSSNCIKELSTKDFKKPCREDSGQSSLPGREYKCIIENCGRWIRGTCINHPLVFVKENRPLKIIYSALDTVPEFLYIAQSTIPDAGVGVFTRIPLPSGVAFGPYAGFLTYSTRAVHGGYAWEQYRFDWQTCWIDAVHELFSNWLRYVNCPRWEEEQNLTSCFYYGKWYYYTYKFIPAGSELMIWYGENYAKHLNISVDYGTDDYNPKFAPPKTDLI